MVKRILALLASGIMVTGAYAYKASANETRIVSITNANGTPGTTLPQRIVQEDEPSWNCKTMGNRNCGPAGFASIPKYEGNYLCWDEYKSDFPQERICALAIH